MRNLLLPTALLLLAALAAARPTNANSEFSVRITIVSQCGPQTSRFGPLAPHNTQIVCQSSSTPFRMQEINLDTTGDAEDNDTSSTKPAKGRNIATANASPTPRQIIMPPLPAQASLATKVVYIAF